MVEIARLFEEEDVGVANAEQNGGDAIEQSEDDQHGQDAQHQEVPVHAVAGPGRHPVETEIPEVERRLDPVLGDPALAEIAYHHPQHQEPEKDPRHHQRGDVDALCKPLPQPPDGH